ncbi:zonadhesin-like [Oncorhynchus nerka]|uniref:zonadhesin-like n=1 Tax=Oncorhynchus nerka TaxID=8023 RepID=UPI0031B80C99
MAISPTVTLHLDDGVVRGLDLQSCAVQLCKGHGHCVAQGQATTCECILGYRGEFCHESVNEAIGVPLTLGVVAFIVGILILSFLIAFIRQRVKVKRKAAAKDSRGLEKDIL